MDSKRYKSHIRITIKPAVNSQQNYENIQVNILLSRLSSINYSELMFMKIGYVAFLNIFIGMLN